MAKRMWFLNINCSIMSRAIGAHCSVALPVPGSGGIISAAKELV